MSFWLITKNNTKILFFFHLVVKKYAIHIVHEIHLENNNDEVEYINVFRKVKT